jgi:triphosphoribosyl-dephospho-CoA synthetase
MYTPADLFKSAAVCANKGNAEDSARLFLFARIYGSYDMARVQDRSAHQGITVLIQKTFAAMGKNANAVEKEINDNLIGKPKEFSEFCRVVKRIGKPNYHPQYMISHGMSAFTGTKGNGLIEEFDESQAWVETLSRCG